MKKCLAILVTIFLSSTSFAQWDFSASMGLDFKSMPNFRDYVNVNFASANNQISSFKSAVAFSTELDYKVAKNFAVGFEYNLQLDSYLGSLSNYEISYGLHRPSLMAYYLIPGAGYQFKLGGGLGYRYALLREKIITRTDYVSSGIGLLLKAEGNTLLANNFYALIGGNLRYDNTGELANGSQNIINKSNGEKLNLNSISVGIYLGVTFTF
ncbi:MAG: hypothetical protein FD143_636 [Ignavibacteria bacterium]|nr:MAG: hypothetical protein FD143_636 [Ignavibacteria bacterium]KAF0161466.1 MAG: hypothetical protein FD188_837 [Ignavibacteria bacterium]